MKNIKLTPFKVALLTLLVITISCERDISDDASAATFSNTADVFTDAPVGLTDAFFISFDPAVGANTQGFGTDDNESYEGTSSIRIDVPKPNDPNGNFIGGIFKDRGIGRDLTGYDALTFWVKGSVTGTIEVGFGTDFEQDQYPVSTVIQLSTDWRKITIPFPDASKLIQEKGMFLFSAGSYDVLQNDDFADATSFDDNIGFTFWMDEIRFENLGTIGQPRPMIFDGQDLTQEVFSGTTIQTTGISYTANLASGLDQNVQLSTNYFTFSSSDTSIATVSDTGLITVDIQNEGTATITASIGSQNGVGSLEVTSIGSFVSATDPTLPQTDVTSIYSDFYTSVTGFNPGIFAGSNTQNISIQSFSGNSHVNYEGIDFIGIGWDNTVNVSGETMVHLDVQLTGGSNLKMELIDFGPDDIDNGFGGSDGTAGGNNISSQLVLDQWVSIDIPLSQFTLSTGGGGSGNPNLSNIGFIVFVSGDGASFLVDNIYFY